MNYKELVQKAAAALSESWNAEDSGDSGTTEKKWARRYAEQAAEESGRDFRAVWREVQRIAVDF